MTAGPCWCLPLLAGVWQASPSPARVNPRAAAPLGRRRSAKINTWPSTAQVSVSRAVGSIPSPGQPLPLARAGSVLHGRTQTAQLCQQWSLRIPHSCQLFWSLFCSLHVPHVATAVSPRRARGQGWLSTELLCSPLVTIPCSPGPLSSGSPASNPPRLLNTGQAVAVVQSGSSLNCSHSCQGLSLVRQGAAPQPPMQAPHAKLSKELAEAGAWGLLAPGPACSSSQQQTRL